MGAMLRKYGANAYVDFPLIKAGATDFATSSDYTEAAGDVQIKKDSGSFANATNALSYLGRGMWRLNLTNTEMQAAAIVVTVIDSATKVIADQSVLVETYGHASARHPFDLSSARVDVGSLFGDALTAQIAAALKFFFDEAAPSKTMEDVGTGGGGGGLTAQQVADALKLAPSAGAPAAGSAQALLEFLEEEMNAPTSELAAGAPPQFEKPMQYIQRARQRWYYGGTAARTGEVTARKSGGVITDKRTMTDDGNTLDVGQVQGP